MLTNSARIVDECLPVKELADRRGQGVAQQRSGSVLLDVRLGARSGRLVGNVPLFLLDVRVRLKARRTARSRLAALYTEIEQVRDDSFCAGWRITDLIRHAEICGAPDPGIVCPDDGPEFTALEDQVRAGDGCS